MTKPGLQLPALLLWLKGSHAVILVLLWNSFFWLLLSLSFVAVSCNTPKSLNASAAWS